MQTVIKKLSYWIVDLDDTLFHLDSKIRLVKDNKIVKLTTSEFVLKKNDVSYTPPNNDWEQAFLEFRDNKSKSNFLRVFKKAIKENKFAPSFEHFKECLIGGNLFAIVTARGHHYSVFKKAISYLIKTVLSESERAIMLKNLRNFYDNFNMNVSDKDLLKYYLNQNEYIGISHPDLIEKYGINRRAPEETKKKAVKDFVLRVSRYYNKLLVKYPELTCSIGFSEDDNKTLITIEKLFKELTQQHPKIEFVLFDAADKTKTEILV